MVALPPPDEPLRPNRLGGIRVRLGTLLRLVVAISIPWTWFLVRDLGPPMQLVSVLLPAIVGASLLGLIVSAADSRNPATLLVAASVAAFGWATVIGPRSAQPTSPPLDPVRVAAVTMPRAGGEGAAVEALDASRADVQVVVEPTKRAGGRLLRTPGAFRSGRFVVRSRFPTRQLPLPNGLPAGLVIRFLVRRPDGPFVVYAVRTDDGVLDAALDVPISPTALLDGVRGERLPVIVIGNAGLGDRSTAYRTLTGSLRDALRSGRSASSTLGSVWTPLLVRVDHLFTSASWCAAGGRTFAVPGSDHLGIVASVGACPR